MIYRGLAKEIDDSDLPLPEKLEWALEVIRHEEDLQAAESDTLQWRLKLRLGLSPTMSRILAVLVARRGTLVHRERLIPMLPQDGNRVDDAASVTTELCKLRGKLEGTGATISRYIRAGYVFHAPDSFLNEVYENGPERRKDQAA